MADTLDFELVAPERRLAAFAAREVRIPGSEGDLTVMPDHAALITNLRPGLLKATGAEGESSYVVTGGFAEITPDSASVLAEQAMPFDEVTADFMEQLIAEARSAAESAPAENRDAADKTVADLEALRASAGV